MTRKTLLRLLVWSSVSVLVPTHVENSTRLTPLGQVLDLMVVKFIYQLTVNLFSYTELVLELEHLKIETRLITEMFA